LSARSDLISSPLLTRGKLAILFGGIEEEKIKI
jgi:hypothetical protein